MKGVFLFCAILFLLFLMFGTVLDYKAIDNPTPDEQGAGDVMQTWLVVAVIGAVFCYALGNAVGGNGGPRT